MAVTPRLRGVAAALTLTLDRPTAAAAWLALPFAALLFAQWPLRDLVGAWSRDANDAAQWILALYVALALRAATRAHAHVTTGFAHDDSPRRRRPGDRPLGRRRRAGERGPEALDREVERLLEQSSGSRDRP